MDKEIIILFGKPGAGKGTQLSAFLEKHKEGFEAISVSNLLRRAKRERGELGRTIEYYMNSGKLVPDDIINKIVLDAIVSSTKNIFLDGYPRTLGQAKAMANSGIVPTKIINFYVDDEIVFSRAKNRLACANCGETYTTNGFKPPKVEGVCDICHGKLVRRKDDEESVVKNRIETYNAETLPVLDFFQRQYVAIYTIDNSSYDTASQNFSKILI